MKDVRRTIKPHDRLTGLAGQVMDGWEEHSNHRTGDRLVIMLYGAEGDAGIGFSGYEKDGDTAVMADILVHLHAIFAANGKELSFVTLDEKGQG